MRLREPFYKGKDAAKAGLSFNHNPYIRGTLEWQSWSDGWTRFFRDAWLQEHPQYD